jgi:hypothetical protein
MRSYKCKKEFENTKIKLYIYIYIYKFGPKHVAQKKIWDISKGLSIDPSKVSTLPWATGLGGSQIQKGLLIGALLLHITILILNFVIPWAKRKRGWQKEKKGIKLGRSSGIRRLWTRKPPTYRASVLAEVAEVAVSWRCECASYERGALTE